MPLPWRRNAAIYKRTWLWNILPNFFEPVFYLVAIGVGLGAYITQMGGTSYISFLAPALVCVAAMHGASFEVTYNVYVRLTFEKAYDAMLTTPIEPGDILAGEVLWAVTRSSIYGGTFFIVVALAGLAPYNRDSGKSRSKRSIQGGRAKVRKCLYMAARTAARHNPVIKPYVEGLLARDKPYKSALGAAMRKDRKSVV